MARKKKLFQEVDAEEVTESTEVLTAPEEKEFPDDFQNLIDEFGPQFYIIIERYNDDGMPEIVGKFSSDSFDQFAIGEKYGGGRFRFTIRNDHGAYVRRFVRTYAKPLIKPEHYTKPDESSKQMIELMREQLKTTQEEQKSTASALVNMMSKVMETTIAVTSRPQNGGSGMDDMLKMITMLGLNKPTNPMENISSVMDLFKNGLEMGKTMNSFSADSKPEDVVLMKLAEGLMPLLSKFGQNKGPQAPQAPQAPHPSTLSITPRTDVIEQAKNDVVNIPVINDSGIPKAQGALMYNSESERIVIETLKSNLSGLLNAGRFNMNPASIADIITEKLDDNSSSRLLDYYTNPENFERTLLFIPEFVSVKEWLRKVLEEIFKCYQPEEPIAPVTATPEQGV